MVPLRHRLANTIAPADSDTARANRLLAGQLRVTEMIAGDAPVLAPLTALAQLMEELAPSSIAGATILNRAGRSFEQAVFPALPDSFSQALVGVTVEPPHVGACAAAVYRGDTRMMAERMSRLLCFFSRSRHTYVCAPQTFQN